MKKFLVITLLLFGFIIQSKAQPAKKIIYEAKDKKVQKVEQTITKKVISENIPIPPGFTAEQVVVALNEGKGLVRYENLPTENTFPFFTNSRNKYEYKWSDKNSDWVLVGVIRQIVSTPKDTGLFIGILVLGVVYLVGLIGYLFHLIANRPVPSVLLTLDMKSGAIFFMILSTVYVFCLSFLIQIFNFGDTTYSDFFASIYKTWITVWVIVFLGMYIFTFLFKWVMLKVEARKKKMALLNSQDIDTITM
jgi:hypothetical protein